MSKFMVRDGAPLYCTFGSCHGCLKATRDTGAQLKEANEAVASDFLPEVNIPSFGLCSSPIGGGECVPVTIMPWIQTKDDMLVGKQPVLMDDSILPCLKGGLISVVKHGQ